MNGCVIKKKKKRKEKKHAKREWKVGLQKDEAFIMSYRL
jgi:hypothetical protein